MTLPADHGPDNLWYRFIVTDGTDTDYYADNTTALDGGLGAATDEPIDTSWALMVAEQGFTAPSWAKDAVIYQIFPDRFRNGRSNNDAADRRRPLRRPGAPPRLGHRSPRASAATTPTAPPTARGASTRPRPPTSPTKEQPRGRDYFGGDLMGVRQQLDYLEALGVNTIYFNPIFDAGSNHGYDTQDYTRIDPYFGTQKDWENLVKQAQRPGDPHRPRRRVQPHVVGQPAVRPLRALPDASGRASPRARRTARGSASASAGRQRAVRLRAVHAGRHGHVPTTAGSASTPSR